jgi:hypothetical protein
LLGSFLSLPMAIFFSLLPTARSLGWPGKRKLGRRLINFGYSNGLGFRPPVLEIDGNVLQAHLSNLAQCRLDGAETARVLALAFEHEVSLATQNDGPFSPIHAPDDGVGYSVRCHQVPSRLETDGFHIHTLQEG